MNTIPTPSQYTDYSKISHREPKKTKKQVEYIQLESVFTDKETEFVHIDKEFSASTPFVSEEMHMTKYFAENDSSPALITKDVSTNTYMVLKDDDNTNRVYEEDDEDTRSVSDSGDEEERPKMSYWMQFYVGSLSIVGLYILFRMIKKSR